MSGAAAAAEVEAAPAGEYRIAVRALCEFAAKEGDLDLRFTPSPSAQEGRAGHRAVAARRGSAWQAELALAGRHRHLLVRGRADGYDAGRGLLEEVKTHRGDLARQPDNQRRLHWAQLRVYGWLLCQQQQLEGIVLSLVYFDIGSERETAFEERAGAAELQRHFEALCERFLDWAAGEMTHRRRRDEALAGLRFPHAGFRSGQRELSTAVYNAARSGRTLVAQAPTGIGKTVGTLFPLLKACPGQAIDKLFFLTAKGSGRRTALDAMARIAGDGLPLRVAELVAREKACEHPDKACDGESCPLARGFYDRLPAARNAAVAAVGALDAAALRGIAAAHAVCPYYLGQEMARWADVVVADYNHWFDGHALLHALTLAEGWRVAVLVDEAHNLVERGRAMYSAELDPGTLREARRAAPAALQRPLERLQRAWSRLQPDGAAYRVESTVPPAFAAALQRASAALADELAETPSASDSPLLRLQFELLAFARLLESFDDHSLFDIRVETGMRRPALRPGLRNLVPASFLAPRFAAAHATVLFSATLAPLGFYADTLGLPKGHAWVEVPSPFDAAQLTVRLARQVSTRFRDRSASVAPIARLIAAQFAEQPGNYLAFFSSFDYLEEVAGRLADLRPELALWRQSRRMDAAAREAFLARFAPQGCGVGFAVLGGIFAEGIDLPGSRLVGAFVATLGLPQVNDFNEAMREQLERRFGAGTGYDYTYLYPGLRKVVQAAGRVIRSPTDRGVLHLIDDRFARPAVRQLLPSWWRIESDPNRRSAERPRARCETRLQAARPASPGEGPTRPA